MEISSEGGNASSRPFFIEERARPCCPQSRRALIEQKRKEWAQRDKQADAFAEQSYPEGAQLCTKCNTAAVVMMDGCMTCLSCGESKCG